MKYEVYNVTKHVIKDWQCPRQIGGNLDPHLVQLDEAKKESSDHNKIT